MKPKPCILIILFIFAISACTTHDDNERMLEYALEFAGDNRSELERVLTHYGNDPEKHEAPSFSYATCPITTATKAGNSTP